MTKSNASPRRRFVPEPLSRPRKRSRPTGIFCANDFSQVAADFGGIGVDGADNFDGLFFPHQARDGSADGADTKLDGANFLFHLVLRPFAAAAGLQPPKRWCTHRAFSSLKKPLR